MEDAQEMVEDQDQRLEEEVEAFLKQMHDRFGENALEELEEEVPLEELGGAEVEGPYLEQRSARAGGFDQEEEMENLLNSLYSDGYNRAYGGEAPAEEELYDPRALRDYPQPYNPWLENGEDNYY